MGKRYEESAREIHLGCGRKCPGHGKACGPPGSGSDGPHICPNSGPHNVWQTSRHGLDFLIVCKGDNIDPTDPLTKWDTWQAIDKWIMGKD